MLSGNRFDVELQKVNEQLKEERLQREKLLRDRDELATEKYNLEQQLKVGLSCSLHLGLYFSL